MPSVELLQALRRALLVEQEKRAKQRGWPLGSDPRLALYEKLDEMRARRCAHGEEIPPMTPAQRLDLEQYLAKVAEREAAKNS